MLFKVKLDTVKKANLFVNAAGRYDFEIDASSGRYRVDAKSILGVFSLDLSKSVIVEVHSDYCQSFLNDISSIIEPEV